MGLQVCVLHSAIDRPKRFPVIEGGGVQGLAAIQGRDHLFNAPVDPTIGRVLARLERDGRPETHVYVEDCRIELIEGPTGGGIALLQGANPDRLDPNLAMEELQEFGKPINGNLDVLNDRLVEWLVAQTRGSTGEVEPPVECDDLPIHVAA